MEKKKAFVGFHTRLSDHEAVDDFIAMIEEDFAPMDFTAVIVELNPGYTYRCFPQYSNGGITYEDLQKIGDACRRHNMEPIPLIQCLSHQSNHLPDSGNEPWPLLQDHPEFSETPMELATAEWPDIYTFHWCCSNDDIYEYFFPMMDEIIEAMGAKFVHVGLDEVFDIGEETCPLCKGKNKGYLFARTVKILHDHLAEKGIEMMMWGDRLLDAKKLGYNMWEADRTGAYEAFDDTERVTRDIIITDWHYERTAFDFPSIEQFMKGGFRVIPSVGRDLAQCQDFWKYALEYIYLGKKLHWPGEVSGILFTQWRPLTKESIARLREGIHGVDQFEGPRDPAYIGDVIAKIEPKAKYFTK